MDPSLTIVVPIQNEADQLRSRVEQLLEVAADVASHFEILLVDDASYDQTDEVACELSKQYPQVRMVRHSEAQGANAAARTGLLRSRGNLVFIHDQPSAPARRDLQDLWQRGGQKHLVVGSSDTTPLYLRPDLISRLQTWGMLVAAEESASQRKSVAPPHQPRQPSPCAPVRHAGTTTVTDSSPTAT